LPFGTPRGSRDPRLRTTALHRKPKTNLLGQAIVKIQPGLKKYENSSQGQRSRSNVTKFQSLLAFTTGHIPTKLHQFPTSILVFAIFCGQTHRQTDKCRYKQNNDATQVRKNKKIIKIILLVRHDSNAGFKFMYPSLSPSETNASSPSGE